MNIQLILQYYALFCLCAIPVTIPLYVLLYKKTTFIDDMNTAIDKMLGIKHAPIPTPAAEHLPTEPAQAETNDSPEKSGVTLLRLFVGDTYHCRPSAQNQDIIRYVLQWYSTNEFIGKIENSEAVFTALRVGKTTVGCYRNNDAYDNGSDMYEIDVVPANVDTETIWMLESLLGKKTKDLVVSHFMNRKVTYNNPQTGAVKLEGKGDDAGLYFQFDKEGKLVRIMTILKEDDEESITRVEEKISNWFEKADIGNDKITFWTRRNIDDRHDEVEQYAYMRKLPSGKTVLAISQFWREYGEIEEFYLNIHMAQKLFSELDGDTEPVKVTYMPEKETRTESQPDSKPGKNIPEEPTPENTPEEKETVTGEDENIGPGEETRQDAGGYPAEENDDTENDSGEDGNDNTGGMPSEDEIPYTNGPEEPEEEEPEPEYSHEEMYQAYEDYSEAEEQTEENDDE